MARSTFDYPAKSGKQRFAAVADPEVCEVVATLLAREDDDPELLAYRDDEGHWVNVSSRAINAYLAESAAVPLFRQRTSAPGRPPCCARSR